MSEWLCPRDCPNRHARCHGSCPDYKRFVEENQKKNEERKKQTAINVYQVQQKKINQDIIKNHKTWKGRRRKT